MRAAFLHLALVSLRPKRKHPWRQRLLNARQMNIMAAGKREERLVMSVLLTLFCGICQLVSVTSQQRANSKESQRWLSISVRSCIPVFEVKYPWLHSHGATPFSNIQKEEDCKNACVTDERCASYQIDTNPQNTYCWLQLEKANLGIDNMYDMKSVTEYILVSRCGDPGAGKSTVEAGLCFPVFENKNPGWVSRLATHASDVKTDSECKATCVSIKACVSYQIEMITGGIFCWLQYSEQRLIKDKMYQSSTIKEYVLVDRCSKVPVASSCIPVFEVKYPWIQSQGATPFSNIQKEEDCKNACVTDERCVSYQIDANPKNTYCWLQLDKANLVLDNVLDMKSVTEYILVNRCSNPEVDQSTVEPGLCLPVFENKNPGWVSRLATHAHDVKTENECKAICVSTKACVSYQIEMITGGIFCWLQYSEQRLIKDKMYQSSTIKEYILVDRCPKVPEVVITTKRPDTCSPVFEKKNPGWISRQATSAPNAKTEAECKAACVTSTTCVSYQIERKSSGILCWLQYNQLKLAKDQLIKSDKIEEYILVERCKLPSAIEEKECFVTMKPSMFGQLSANATLYESAKDERTCVAACISRRECISVQFKSSEMSWLCYLQHNLHAFKPENLMYHPNVTEYVITKRCDENNACSKGFPLKRWGVPIYFRARRDVDEYSNTDDEEIAAKEEGTNESSDEVDVEAADNEDSIWDCEVVVQPVGSGLSTANAVPFKSALTDSGCISACVADRECISAQHNGHSKYISFECALQYDIKAFEPKKLLYRPNISEYIITKRCSENNLCLIDHQSHNGEG